VEVQPVFSERLELVWLSPVFVEALLAGRLEEAQRVIGATLPPGWPEEDTLHWLAVRLKRMTDDPEAAPWLTRAMLRRSDGAFVGDIGFHGKPNAARQAELGYTVEAEYRRQGYASEAALALIDWARREHAIRRFLVSISPSNAPSLGLAAKLGFQRIGTQMDEIDGEEYVFERVFAD
jgi:RimJ/RimL family protein N-acetyltransferase